MSNEKDSQRSRDDELHALVLYLTRGGVHGIPPVSQEPATVLMNWRLFRVAWPDGRRTRHMIGRNTRTDEGRVCSAIKCVDFSAFTFTTSSGRVYHVYGPNRHDGDAAYVFGVWLEGIQGKAVEITEPFLRLLRMRAPQVLDGIYGTKLH
ncbi:hypothetical protein ACLBKS_02710 [Hylemonella sp. W303a]|uniref:hypothetical protein n=1 Tax=Hylemonella sp. W303a TaxID=3389873 RepID=UPI00396AF769